MTKSELMRAIYRLTHGTNVEYKIIFENPEGTEMTFAFTDLHHENKKVESTIGG